MFAKALVILALGATSTFAADDLKTCTFVPKTGSSLAGTGKLIKDGETYKVAVTVTAAHSDTTKTWTSKAATVPDTAISGADYAEVSGFTYSAVAAEKSVALPGSVITKDNIKAIVTTKADNTPTAVCTFADVSTSAAATFTLPVLAATGLAMSLTL